MLRTAKLCAGCGQTLHAGRDQWCPMCEPTVKPYVVQLTAAQRRHIEAQALFEVVSVGKDKLPLVAHFDAKRHAS